LVPGWASGILLLGDDHMNTVKRYEWEDTLLEAEKQGHLEPGAVNFCLRLSKAIKWEPKGGKPSGLYWKNTEAFRDVGTSRPTYFRYKESLFKTGFLTEEKGNLIPLVPDLSRIETVYDVEESQVETNESHIETVQSHIETEESQIDTPYSGDTYTGDSFTVDNAVEDTPQASPAAGDDDDSSLTEDEEVTFSKIIGPDGSLASLTAHVVNKVLDLQEDWGFGTGSEDAAGSQIETEPDELDCKLDEYEQSAKTYATYDADEWVGIRARAREAYTAGAHVQKACGIGFGAVSA